MQSTAEDRDGRQQPPQSESDANSARRSLGEGQGIEISTLARAVVSSKLPAAIPVVESDCVVQLVITCFGFAAAAAARFLSSAHSLQCHLPPQAPFLPTASRVHHSASQYAFPLQLSDRAQHRSRLIGSVRCRTASIHPSAVLGVDLTLAQRRCCVCQTAVTLTARPLSQSFLAS